MGVTSPPPSPIHPTRTARAFPGWTHYDILEDEAFLAQALALAGAH